MGYRGREGARAGGVVLEVVGWVIVGGDGARAVGLVMDVGGAVIVEVGGGEGDDVLSRRTCPWRMLPFSTGAVD